MEDRVGLVGDGNGGVGVEAGFVWWDVKAERRRSYQYVFETAIRFFVAVVCVRVHTDQELTSRMFRSVPVFASGRRRSDYRMYVRIQLIS